jgi:hypothetical protein
MPLLTVILTIVIVGLLLWLIERYVPMEAGTKKILNIVVIIAMAIWLLKVFGMFDYLNNITL